MRSRNSIIGQSFALEQIEGRRLYAASPITVNGTAGPDEIYVVIYGNYIQVSNNDQVTNYATNTVSGITINGGSGADDLEVSYLVTVPCTLVGNSGDDILFGGSGDDLIYGGDGQDYIHGKNGNDYIDCGWTTTAGTSLTYGDAGNDTIYGGMGMDKMYGGLGADWLYGGGGGNTYCGNDGDNNDDFVPDNFGHSPSEQYAQIYGQPNDVNF